MLIQFPSKTATLCAAVFLIGCSGNAPLRSTSSSHPSMGIKTGNSSINTVTCQRFYPDSKGYRAFIGVELESIEPIVIGYFYCNAMSPAESAGILIGDKIKNIRGCPVSTSGDVKSIIQDTAPKTTVFIDIERSGRGLSIPVRTLRHLPMNAYFPSRDKYKNSCNLQ